jgi:uncharacterized protein YbjQ (UPF0145 family)
MPGSGRFRLPWQQPTAEERAARTAAAEQRAAAAQRLAEARRAAAERQATDLEALGRGGIPVMAAQRLHELRGADPAHTTFSSDLSPDEAALLRRAGHRPLGLVSGSAVYHVGRIALSPFGGGGGMLFPTYGPAAGELTALSAAYTEATRLAVSRLQQEAQAIGAHGVVGVRFTLVRRAWSQKSIEVQLLGTAVAGPEHPPASPWLSDLSGQEWFALHRAGYVPAGFVHGHCAWLVLTSQQDLWTLTSWTNRELPRWSDALRQCRTRATRAMASMAREYGGTGIVGVHLTRDLEEVQIGGTEIEHHLLTLHLVGTAVRLRPDAPTSVGATGMVLSLRDGRITPLGRRPASAAFE